MNPESPLIHAKHVFRAAILLIAVAVATSWYFIMPERAFVVTLSVLVVTCPCALALATPAAFATAGTRLSDLHLLITNGNAIEALSRASRILFDKTGTLTRGTPAIVSTVILDDNFEEQQCLQIAAALETVSTHPIVKEFASQLNLFPKALKLMAAVIVKLSHWEPA